MDDLKKFSETSLPEINISTVQPKCWRYYWCRLQTHKKSLGRLWDKKLKYHNLHVWNHTVLLANIFTNFSNMCLEIYELVFLLHQD